METVGKAVLILPPRISSSAAIVVDRKKPQSLPAPTAQQVKATRATKNPSPHAKPTRTTQDQSHAKNKDKEKDRPKRSAPAPIVIPSRSGSESDSRREAVDRRRAVLRALEVIASSSRVLEPKHAVARRIGVQ